MLRPHIRTGEAIILQKMYRAVWLPLIRGCDTVTEQTQIGLLWALPDKVSLLTTKHIITEEYAKGTKIILIDPEREYKKLTKDMGGDWLDVGGGAGGMVNPLQIRPMPEDDDDETGEYEENDSLRLNGKENKGMGDLALHLKTLEIFFSLYLPEISDYEKAYLNKALRELYAKYGITLTMRLKDKKIDKFPIIKDLYDYLREKSGDKELPEDETEKLQTSCVSFENAAIGQTAFCGTVRQALNLIQKWICLDTHPLQNSSDKVRQSFDIIPCYAPCSVQTVRT